MVTRLDLAREVRAANDAAAVWDRSSSGRLRATGKDVLDLLNRLSTNQVDPLEVGRVASTVLTTNKGRILDVLTVCRAPDHVLILTSAGALEKVAAWLDRYTFTEDVAFADVAAQTAQFAVTGPRAAELMRSAFGPQAGSLEHAGCLVVGREGTEVLLARTDPLGTPGYDVVAPASLASSLRERLLEAGRALGAMLGSPEAWEALRILAGIPRYDRELTESHNPLEAGLERAVSWTKGCYIGQEVVARLHTYHKVQRYLVRLTLAAEAPPPAGARLMAEGNEVGVLTSAALVPGTAEVAALAYLRTASVRQGLELQAALPGGRSVPGRVVWVPELPPEALTPAQLLALAEEPEE